MIRKIIYLIALTRPVNMFITVLTIGLIGLLIGDPISLNGLPVLMAALSAGFIGAGANASNDVFDIEIDRINKPRRPIPAGKVTAQEAVWVWLILTTLGIMISAGINWVCAAIAVLTAVLIHVYNRFLKKTPLWGNLAVSFMTGMVLIYVGTALNRIEPTLIPALFAFFIHLAREIIKDMEDIDGDKKNGANTFPIRFGLKKSMILVTVIIALLTILTTGVSVADIYPLRFLIFLAAGIYPLFIYSLALMWLRPEKKSFQIISLLFKISMVIGVFAIFLTAERY